MTSLCFCGKDRPYADCCGRFISGGAVPRTPEQLMRSRYSAYAMGGQGEYLLRTWFPATAKGLSAAQLDQQSVTWSKLQVVAKSQRGDEGVVEFKAWFIDADGQRQLLHEKSIFTRVGGRWFYVGGEVDDGSDD